MTKMLKVKKGPKVKRALKTILVLTVIIGAAVIGSKYFNCSLVRDFRIDPDKRIHEIKQRIEDIEKDDVKDTKNIKSPG